MNQTGKKMPDWQPATLDEVQLILGDHSRQLHRQHQQCIEQMLIRPVQIPVLLYPGVSVWAIAKHEDKFLYWSDIEDGWELEALQPDGGIQDRGCNQFELHHIMYQLFGDPDLLP